MGDGGLAIQASIDRPFGVAADAYGNIFVSESGGNRVRKISTGASSWTPINSGLGNLDVYSYAVHRNFPQTVYAATNGGGIYRTTNGGGSWSAINSGLGDLYVNTVVVDPANNQNVYAGTMSGGLFKSTNGGNNWSAANSGLGNMNVYTIACQLGTPTLYAGTNGGGIFKSTDFGNNWTAKNSGLSDLNVNTMLIHPDGTLFAGTKTGGIFRSTNGGDNWTQIVSGLGGMNVGSIAVPEATPQNPRPIYVGTNNGVYLSSDNGNSWSAASTGLPASYVRSVLIDPTDAKLMHAGTFGGGVYRSYDGGSTWAALNRGLANTNVQVMLLDPSNGQTVYAGTSGGAYKLAKAIVSKSSIAFGSAQIGGMKQDTLKIVNISAADFLVESVQTHNAAFTLPALSVTSSMTVAAGKDTSIAVRYSPSAGGNYADSVTVASGGSVVFSVKLTGTVGNIAESTPAWTLLGSIQASAYYAEVPILFIGLTGEGSASVNSATLTISDLSSPSGLVKTDFRKLNFYWSADALYQPSDTRIGVLDGASINIGTPTTISATAPDVPPNGVQRYYIVTAVIDTGAISGHAFKVGFAAGGIATNSGGIGTAVSASDKDRVEIRPSLDFTRDDQISFNDFFLFADGYGRMKGAPGFNDALDLNWDGRIDSADFLTFAQNFAASPGNVKIAPPLGSGPNAAASYTAVLDRSSGVQAGQTFQMTVRVKGASGMSGYAAEVLYDSMLVTDPTAMNLFGSGITATLREPFPSAGGYYNRRMELTASNLPVTSNTFTGDANLSTFTFTAKPGFTATHVGSRRLIVTAGAPRDTLLISPYPGNYSINQTSQESPGIITTFAGSGPAGVGVAGAYAGDGGPAVAARLNGPLSVTIDDATGYVYIPDPGNHRVRRVGPDGIITTFAGNGTTGHSGDGGSATQASLDYPTDVALDAKGNVYISASKANRVRRVDPNGTITTVAGNGTAAYAGDGGLATVASLKSPRGIALDAAGNLYIADWNNHRVRKVGLDGVITTFAGIGAAGFSGDGGQATAASLNEPISVCVDPKGNVYIADRVNVRVRCVGTNGIITTVAGNGTAGYSGDGGLATGASLGLASIALDAGGFLYLADVKNQRIRRVNPGGSSNIITIAGTGVQGFAGDGGLAIAAPLGDPSGIAVDGGGNLYIAEAINHRIRRVTPGPVMYLSSPLLVFDSTSVGGTSQRALTATNVGNGNLAISGVTIGGSDASQFTVSPSTANLPGGGKVQSFTVTFSPTTRNQKSGFLSIAHNGVGSPVVISLTGPVPAVGLGGTVRYANPTGPPVDSVRVTMTGDSVQIAWTDTLGSYAFPKPFMSFGLTASKGGSANNAIQGADALLTLQRTAFLAQPASAGDLSVDVNGDGTSDNADALAILRYLAFYTTNVGDVGKWRFGPGPTTQDFTAYLAGDVDHSWTRKAGLPKSAASPVIVSLQEVRGKAGEEVRIPIVVRSGSESVSTLMASLAYDPAILEYHSAHPADLGQGYLLVVNGETGGQVHIAVANAQGIRLDGPFLELVFKGREPATSPADRAVPRERRSEVSLMQAVVNDLVVPGLGASAVSIRDVPRRFELSQNYPNPFNPVSQIEFGLPADTKVRLTIYNLMGQRIRTLVDDRLEAGYHTVRWDGRSEEGQTVSTGIYFYRLEAPRFTAVKRMLLLK